MNWTESWKAGVWVLCQLPRTRGSWCSCGSYSEIASACEPRSTNQIPLARGVVASVLNYSLTPMERRSCPGQIGIARSRTLKHPPGGFREQTRSRSAGQSAGIGQRVLSQIGVNQAAPNSGGEGLAPESAAHLRRGGQSKVAPSVQDASAACSERNSSFTCAGSLRVWAISSRNSSR